MGGTESWGLTYNDDVGTTLLRGSQGTALGEPVSLGVILDPIGDGSLLLRGDALVGVADALEDVVDVLGDSEDTRTGLGDYRRLGGELEMMFPSVTYRTRSRRRRADARDGRERGA